MTSVHNSDWIEFDLTKNQTDGETTDLMQKQFASSSATVITTKMRVMVKLNPL